MKADYVHKDSMTLEEKPQVFTRWIDPTIKELKQENQELHNKIDKVIEYIEKNTRWFDSEYASIYGELCTCEGPRGNRLEVLVNPSNLLDILKEVE